MRLAAALVSLSCAGLFGGCSNPGSLVAGQSEADVRARAGTPTETRVDSNGDRLLQYVRGPEGWVTYVVRVGADGKVKEVTQALTDDQLAKVVPGRMNQADVRNLLGRPFQEQTLMVGLTWSWRFKRQDTQPGWLVVTFNPDGTVKDKIAIIEPSGGMSRDK